MILLYSIIVPFAPPDEIIFGISSFYVIQNGYLNISHLPFLGIYSRSVLLFMIELNHKRIFINQKIIK